MKNIEANNENSKTARSNKLFCWHLFLFSCTFIFIISFVVYPICSNLIGIIFVKKKKNFKILNDHDFASLEKNSDGKCLLDKLAANLNAFYGITSILLVFFAICESITILKYIRNLDF
jgi:hypothetical protein